MFRILALASRPSASALALAAFALSACQSEKAEAPTPSGPQDFAMLCAPCHGATGVGDGPDASGLAKAPANLTQLSSANGGDFPMARVMGHIWGYTEVTGRAEPGRVMPDFGGLLDSELVLFDSGDGISTPTPSRLVELAVYLKSIQQ